MNPGSRGSGKPLSIEQEVEPEIVQWWARRAVELAYESELRRLNEEQIRAAHQAEDWAKRRKVIEMEAKREKAE